MFLFFYDYETIFCTNEKKNNFEKNIEELSKFNKLDFNIELKKTKKTFSSFTPNYKKFTDFLSQSNLTIREKIS